MPWSKDLQDAILAERREQKAARRTVAFAAEAERLTPIYERKSEIKPEEPKPLSEDEQCGYCGHLRSHEQMTREGPRATCEHCGHLFGIGPPLSGPRPPRRPSVHLCAKCGRPFLYAGSAVCGTC